MIHVFKFGGASVKDAEGVKNLSKIVVLNKDKQVLIVVSAMGKTTNALEQLATAHFNRSEQMPQLFETVKTYHHHLLTNLFGDSNHPIFDQIANTFVEIDWILEDEPHPDYDFNYDQIVSIGELVSTRIVSAYLNHIGLNNQWIDARDYVHTDNTYREGIVDWKKTCQHIQTNLIPILKNQLAITQGFIGGTSENFTTTLGREGSDYTASIFASCLKAESVTIWKDVPGVLNADPKLFENTQKYDELSYSEALEMTYYGASVIHPKTIKPLQNAHISLLVKPFSHPHEPGTTIHNIPYTHDIEPAIIVKKDQVLVSLMTKDFSFITEDHLSAIFGSFAHARIKINMMQVSALSFSVCFDWDGLRFDKLNSLLQDQFKIKYNTALELLTVRHFNRDLIEQLSSGKIILMEQFSRNTVQMVLKDI